MAEFELNERHLAAAGIEPDSNDNQGTVNETTGTDTQSGNTDTTTTASPQDQVQGATGKDSVGDKSDGGTQQGQKEKGKDTNTADLKPGDLKLQDGTIVRAGAERRHFENARMFRSENIALKNDLNTANQKFNSLQERYNALETATKAIGLEDATSVSNAVRLYKDLRSNPVETAKKLLAELKAAGHNLEGIGGAVDTLAIQQVLDERIPQRQGLTPEQQMHAIQEEAVREANQFFSQFPDARMHEGVIANIIAAEAQQGREASPRDVYFRLRQSVINQNMDWGQPLGPQIEARKAALASQQQAQGQQRPIVNGRGGVGTQAATENIDPFKSGNNDTKDAIILAAMKDAGFNYTR